MLSALRYNFYRISQKSVVVVKKKCEYWGNYLFSYLSTKTNVLEKVVPEEWFHLGIPKNFLHALKRS